LFYGHQTPQGLVIKGAIFNACAGSGTLNNFYQRNDFTSLLKLLEFVTCSKIYDVIKGHQPGPRITVSSLSSNFRLEVISDNVFVLRIL
jgi:hypothetical protein